MTSTHYHCGPGYLPQWIKRILSLKFNQCCAVHDHLYKEKLLTRFEIDKRFLEDMIHLSVTRSHLAVAFLYFLIVRLFGWISWRVNK